MLNKIDHTFLKPWATVTCIKGLCEQVYEYGFRGVCVHPCFVNVAKRELPGHVVSAVINFPYGNAPLSTVLDEAKYAIDYGVDELDYVWNLSAVREGTIHTASNGISAIVELGAAVKVIVESGALTVSERRVAHQVVKECGAWCIKTSTGIFHPPDVETVRLWSGLSGLKIKASGGINTVVRMKQMIDAGADIIGTSSGPEIYDSLRQEN